MAEKKSVTKKNKFKVIREEDNTYFKAKIYFNQSGFSSLGIVSTLKYGFEDVFTMELKDKYKQNCFGLLSRFFQNNELNLYCAGWKNKLPVLLSDKTNYLTKTDRYIIAQFPVWLNFVISLLLTQITEQDYLKRKSHDVKVLKKEQKRIERIQKQN
jgi:hypothetical protein